MSLVLSLAGAERAPASAFTIVLNGSADLRGAAALRERLSEALAAHGAVAVDARAVTSCDTGAVQVLLAACRSAERAGRILSVIAEPGGALSDTLQRLGVGTAFG